ncbi:MAG TPA: sigma-54 dependent transcriptional regulator [Polyangiaceae bacterium]|nr:sigma-54 dependent transcriptional regulator [Polyangiaceae bacterium]
MEIATAKTEALAASTQTNGRPEPSARKSGWAPKRTKKTTHRSAALYSLPLGASLLPVRYVGRLAAVSSAMLEVLELVSRFATTDVTVTLTGETGTGKDLLAHALHEQSDRASGPFVVFDCGSVAANLAESELLGHERGSFTGALAAHEGAFERAHGGTLFLDEVGELPLDLQPRLLRVLESRSVRRVGGTRDRALDVRIVAATNRDLRADVLSGKFREDLYFRLAAAIVPVPRLRDRLDDLPMLTTGLLADLGRAEVKVTESGLAVLRSHPWPGNVRELKNAIACALAFVDGGDLLEPRHLRISAAPPNECVTLAIDRLPLGGQKLESIERAAIRQTLVHTENNKAQAAELLGIAVSTLYEKIRKYGLGPVGEDARRGGRPAARGS